MAYFSPAKTLIMRSLMMALTLLTTLVAGAQKYEDKMDHNFKPATLNARYYVVTEKTDSGWHRKAWYLPELGMAMDGRFADKECTIPIGEHIWFHTNKELRSVGSYVGGKKEGTWVEFHDNGVLRDSATYHAGNVRGVRFKWYNDGAISDSIRFDDAGNGVEVGWYKDGEPRVGGYWTNDTLKRGRWQYYHRNGKIKATEDYQGGKKVNVACYDSTGRQLADCAEKEATFPGSEEGWRRFLERNLDASVPVRKGAPLGYYSVRVQFMVNTDGTLSDVKALTNLGYGTEEEVLRMFKKSPKWIPAMQFGQPVRAYRIQPVTFVVQQR